MDNVTQSELLAKSEVQEVIAELKRNIRQALADGDFGAREGAVLAIFNEAMRSLLEEDLKAISASFGERLLVNGVEYKKHEPGRGEYHSLGGAMFVDRDTYRQVGVHNGPTIAPLELVAGLAEHATPIISFTDMGNATCVSMASRC
jgi:hypothetical protein